MIFDPPQVRFWKRPSAENSLTLITGWKGTCGRFFFRSFFCFLGWQFEFHWVSGSRLNFRKLLMWFAYSPSWEFVSTRCLPNFGSPRFSLLTFWEGKKTWGPSYHKGVWTANGHLLWGLKGWWWHDTCPQLEQAASAMRMLFLAVICARWYIYIYIFIYRSCFQTDAGFFGMENTM